MKLFYTTTSPYARKVRITASELSLLGEITQTEVKVRVGAAKILQYNPVGMVPTLELDTGMVLCESSIICDYLDSLNDTPKLLPAPGPDRCRVLQMEGIAQGLLAGVANRVRELRRPKAAQSPMMLELDKNRIERCLDTINTAVEAGAFERDLTIAHITLACALGVLKFRLPSYEWRHSRPILAAWFIKFSTRSSMIETEPHESDLGA